MIKKKKINSNQSSSIPSWVTYYQSSGATWQVASLHELEKPLKIQLGFHWPCPSNDSSLMNRENDHMFLEKDPKYH